MLLFEWPRRPRPAAPLLVARHAGDPTAMAPVSRQITFEGTVSIPWPDDEDAKRLR
jgi:hypothetical protein